MNVKFVIFGAISVLLVAAIYASSFVSNVWALPVQQGEEECYESKSNPLKEICCAWFQEGLKKAWKQCRICTTDYGGTRTCEAWYRTSDSKLIEKLQDLTATGPSDTSNETKVPNTDLLTGENLVESQNNTDDDNSKPPKDLGGLKDEDGSPTINPDLP